MGSLQEGRRITGIDEPDLRDRTMPLVQGARGRAE